ncbi:uncharacterized protein LOC129565736 [Sitodiplosis mosellana]|uniref:uncharacterized protein LOC129565736 n=1 Tax=Sitodiplosis mosellana TaxID=263140 RepID=UPI002444467A|nr:uncharacterized protein LOC129565736 [Sitodiplosis mosellana]
MKSLILLALGVFIICGIEASPFNIKNRGSPLTDAKECQACKDIAAYLKEEVDEGDKDDIIKAIMDECSRVEDKTVCDKIAEADDEIVEFFIKNSPEAICKQLKCC